MTWHYRILRHPNGALTLHEVYCNDAGEPTSWTDPITFGCDGEDGIEGIAGSLEMALADARGRPVLDIPSDHKPSSVTQTTKPAVSSPVSLVETCILALRRTVADLEADGMESVFLVAALAQVCGDIARDDPDGVILLENLQGILKEQIDTRRAADVFNRAKATIGNDP